MHEAKTLRLEAVLGNVTVAMSFVAQLAQSAGFDDQAVDRIQLAVDEACANAVAHAYEGMVRGDMEISCHVDGQDFVISVRDWGRSFDLGGVAEPNVTAPLDERSLGGLGLFLIKKVMDRVQYRPDPVRGNELVMVKRLQFGA